MSGISGGWDSLLLCRSVFMSVWVPVCPSFCSSVSFSLSFCFSFSLSLSVSFSLSLSLSLYLSSHLCNCSSFYLSLSGAGDVVSSDARVYVEPCKAYVGLTLTAAAGVNAGKSVILVSLKSY